MKVAEELIISRSTGLELTVSSMAVMIEECDWSRCDWKAEHLVALRTDEIMASTTANDGTLERDLTIDPIHARP
jgi:hypothetical protein